MSEQPINQLLTAWTQEAVSQAFPDAEIDASRVNVVATNEDGFGDYQCNAAMALAKVLQKAPRDIAQAISDYSPFPDYLERIEIAGPGFINFTLADAWLAQRAKSLLADDRVGVPPLGEGRTVVIDYSSPNVAKPMHIGHIRSTVIGNALDRMYRFLGYKVIADNHLGDWGTQFGKLIMGYRNFLDADALAEAPVEELERLYVMSHNKSEEDEEWLNQCRSELVKLQQGDAENLALWEKFISLSMLEFDKIYGRLGVSFDLTRGESFYNDALAGMLAKLQEKNLLVESDGAQVVDLEASKLGVAIVQKSDGGFNYTTSDLATVQSREEEFSPAAIVYVTDERQQLHFKQFFHISKELGCKAELKHVWFGLMRLPEGTFSTRAGNVIKLEVMLDEAEKRALAILQEKESDMSAEEQAEVARIIGIGAIKYADLSQNPQSLVTFTWDKALALDGNSAPYLMYSYARNSKVLAKFGQDHPEVDVHAYDVQFTDNLERKIVLQVSRFAEILPIALEQHRPNMLADYLYELVRLNSAFYQNLPWLKADEGVRESRLLLAELVKKVLKQGLDLLGMEAPERI